MAVGSSVTGSGRPRDHLGRKFTGPHRMIPGSGMIVGLASPSQTDVRQGKTLRAGARRSGGCRSLVRWARAAPGHIRPVITSRSCCATSAMMPTVRSFASGRSTAANLTPLSLSASRKAAFRDRRSSLAITSVARGTLATCSACFTCGRYSLRGGAAGKVVGAPRPRASPRGDDRPHSPDRRRGQHHLEQRRGRARRAAPHHRCRS